jgi:hypothetical protein
MMRTESHTRLATWGCSLRVWEPLLATLLGVALYASLYGELAYHDAFRFTNQLESGRFVWDIGHIFLQPATLLWHRFLGFGEPAATSQKHISTFAAAAAVGILDVLLLRLNIPALKRAAALLLVATSGSVLILAPSAHMKLLAFPFVNAALLTLATWEQRAISRAIPGRRAIMAGAALLAVAAAFLASALATAPFATLAVWLTALRRGLGGRAALMLATLFALTCGLTFLVLALAGYTVFTGLSPTLHGLTASVTDKAGLRPPSYGLVASLARLVFGTAANIAEAPQLGAIARAWLSGAIPSLAPYRQTLLLQAGPLAVTLALLAAIYLVTLRGALAGARCLVPAAFLCGAQLWTIYYGLNDPEHWFQLTVPSVLLFLLLFPDRFTRLILPAWALLIAAVNIGAFARPYAAYPVARARAELRQAFTPNDLLIGFAAYAGSPSLFLLQLPDIPQLMLDTRLEQDATPAVFYAEVQGTIDSVLARSGRVIVFGGVLDPLDWNAPWVELPARGVTKSALHAFFAAHYTIRPLGRLAGLPTWELTR